MSLLLYGDISRGGRIIIHTSLALLGLCLRACCVRERYPEMVCFLKTAFTKSTFLQDYQFQYGAFLSLVCVCVFFQTNELVVYASVTETNCAFCIPRFFYESFSFSFRLHCFNNSCMTACMVLA